MISKNFQVPLNSLPSVKMAKSSLARGHMGGPNWGCLELGPETPARHGLGGPYTRKKFFRTQVQIHTQRPQIRKEVLPSPPPAPSKKGVPKRVLFPFWDLKTHFSKPETTPFGIQTSMLGVRNSIVPCKPHRIPQNLENGPLRFLGHLETILSHFDTQQAQEGSYCTRDNREGGHATPLCSRGAC